MAHTFSRNHVHVIFSTKERRKTILAKHGIEYDSKYLFG